MISVCIVTYNEAQKLKSCLQNIQSFANEIIVVDLGSEDGVADVCTEFKARLIKHKFENIVEKVRNFVISQAQNDWILLLDPDERVSEELVKKLEGFIAQDQYIALKIPRKNIFFGKWIKHTNWWPDKQIRFFKKGSVEWGTRIHSYPKVTGQIYELDNDREVIEHFGYATFSEFFDRQIRYAQVDARQRNEEGTRFSWLRLFFLPVREFLVRFVKYQGYLDGFYGLGLTVMMMIYQIMVQVNLWEEAHKS